MTESTHYPLLGTVQQGDPSPWHGLVYTRGADGQRMLDPLDGRPPIPFWNKGRHEPQTRGALWDIGRLDPPATPEILAAGGTALGRRVFGPENSYMPARLGDAPRNVGTAVWSVEDAAAVQVMVAQRGWGGELIDDWREVARFSLSDFGVDLADLVDEQGLRVIDHVTWAEWQRGLLFGSWADASPDGARRLYLVRLGGGKALQRWAQVVLGVVEIVLGWHDGALTATAQVVMSAQQCLGSFSASTTNSLSVMDSMFLGPSDPEMGWQPGDTCGFRFFFEDLDPARHTAGSQGTTARTLTMSGLVLGVTYGPTGIVPLRCTITDTDSRSGTMSRPDWVAGIGYNEQQGYYCTLSGPPTSISSTYQRTHTRTVTLTLGAHTLTSTRTSSTQASNREDAVSQRPDGSWEYSFSGDGATTITVDGEMRRSWPTYGGELPVFTVPESRPAMVPSRDFLLTDEFGVAMTSGGVFGNNKWAGVVEMHRLDGELWVGPMIHPGGTHGAWVQVPTTFNDEPYNYSYSAACCPRTGHASRLIDLDARAIVGYL